MSFHDATQPQSTSYSNGDVKQSYWVEGRTIELLSGVCLWAWLLTAMDKSCWNVDLIALTLSAVQTNDSFARLELSRKYQYKIALDFIELIDELCARSVSKLCDLEQWQRFIGYKVYRLIYWEPIQPTVRQITPRRVIAIASRALIKDISLSLFELRASQLPVVKQGNLLGV